MMKHIYISSCDKSGGIYHYAFENGNLNFVNKTPLDRPMYAIVRERKLYVILRETDVATHFGGLLSFDIDCSGNLVNATEIESTNGICPCHLEVTGNEKFIVNYLSGNLVKVGEKTVSHSGKSIHPTRQEAAHTHFVAVSTDQQYVLCSDLGLDTVFVYDRKLNDVSSAKVPEGSGCRHLCFHGNLVYCVNELSSDVSVFTFENGILTLLGTYDAIPDYKRESTAAAIRVYENRLYVSHRGADCVSCFEICGDTLKLLWNTPCGGHAPRDFNVVDGYLICANEGGNISVLRLFDNGAELISNDIQMRDPLCVTIL